MDVNKPVKNIQTIQSLLLQNNRKTISPFFQQHQLGP